MKRITFFYFPILLLFAVLCIKCTPKSPVVTFANPSGVVGDTIEVKVETDLILEKIDHSILFGTVPATVVSTIQNTLKVIVPKEAITSKIGLTIGSETFTSAEDFVILHIYVAGNVNRIPTYWKDGQASAVSDGPAAGVGLDMAVRNGKIYLCGYKALTNSTSIAKYWVNGQPTDLTDGTTEARASGIWIDSNDVYIAGIEIAKKGNDEVTQAKYWKNGTPVLLAVKEGEAYAQSIYVTNGDVYVSGYATIGNSIYPLYWKNGQETVFKDIVGGVAFPTSIAAAGADVYLMADERRPMETNQPFDYFNLVYWKNKQKITVPLTSSDAEAKSIQSQSHLLVSGQDVYFTANQYDKDLKILSASYWKNDQETKIGNAKGDIVSAIALSDNDVYVAGYDDSSVMYWKNGVATTILKDAKYPNANQIVLAP